MVPAVADEVAHERVGGLDATERLAQVDEIDPVALTKDVALHLRVPSAGLVAEVDPGLQELSHGNDGHRYVPPVGCSPGAAPPAGGDRGNAPGDDGQVLQPTAVVGRATLAARPSRAPAPRGRVLRPGGGSPRTPSGAAPCSRACTSAWWPGSSGRGAPGRPAGRRPRRGGAWRTCGAGRAGGSATGAAVEDAADVTGPEAGAALVHEHRLGRAGHGVRPCSSQPRIASAAASWIGRRRCLYPLPSTVTVRARRSTSAAVEAAELRDAQPGGVEQLEHRVVAPLERRRRPGRRAAWRPHPSDSTRGSRPRRSARAASGPGRGRGDPADGQEK